MVGLPKKLNSREDCEYLLEHFSAEEWLPYFEGLLEGANEWFWDRELESPSDGIEDETHKVVESTGDDMSGGEPKTIYIQYEYRPNPNCDLLRFGYTVPEVQEIVAKGKAELKSASK